VGALTLWVASHTGLHKEPLQSGSYSIPTPPGLSISRLLLRNRDYQAKEGEESLRKVRILEPAVNLRYCLGLGRPMSLSSPQKSRNKNHNPQGDSCQEKKEVNLGKTAVEVKKLSFRRIFCYFYIVNNMPTKRRNSPDLLTIPQAAKFLLTTRQAVGSAIKRGRIKVVRYGHVSLMLRSSLEDYKNKRHAGGRPRKKTRK